MSMGKACIASSVDGTNELVNSGENGILINTKDHHALAKHIINLHLHPTSRKILGDNAIKYIQQNYSLDEMVDKIQNLYSKTAIK